MIVRHTRPDVGYLFQVLEDANSSVLIEEIEDDESAYVVMPMKL